VTFQEPPSATPADSTAAGVASASVTVPKRAVVERNGRTTVWVVTGGVASARDVTLGPTRLDVVEIANGLAPGEAVVLSPPNTLTDNGRVRVKGT
jgi:hypothetical protein